MLLAFFQEDWLGNKMLARYLQFSGVFVLPTAWLALVLLHERGAMLFLFMFVLIWVADSAAYFTGKRFGKTKLAAALSPGKTREGLWGALIAGAGFAVIGVVWLPVELQFAAYFIMLCLICVLISVVGDLFESLLKRNAGVKDSGNILPGHGGLLDRVDSVLAAAPVFLFGYHWMLM